MTEDQQALVRATVSATLQTVAEWGLAFQSTPERPARDELRDIAEQVDRLERDEVCCPLCEEVDCDEGCPLTPLRAQNDVRDEGAAA
jgi:hypothetical protein